MSDADSSWCRDDFVISTEKRHLDLDTIHGFLTQSYWASGISRELVAECVAHTPLCFGLYQGDPTSGGARQVGFARVITDRTTFAYLADVFVLPEFRGRGLSKWLMEIIRAHEDLQGLRRFLLATQDAHGLYAQYGFTPLARPERWMEIAPGPSVYAAAMAREDPK